jgi:hypothetical protein
MVYGWKEAGSLVAAVVAAAAIRTRSWQQDLKLLIDFADGRVARRSASILQYPTRLNPSGTS